MTAQAMTAQTQMARTAISPSGGAGWITATVRPAGELGQVDADRLAILLGALSMSASVVVLDLEVARLRGGFSAAVVDAAAEALEARGGCLLCVNADDESRASLASAGEHAVLLASADGAQAGAHGPVSSPTVDG